MCFKQQVERREIIDTSTPFAGSKTQFLAIGKTLAPPSHEQQVCELISGISVQQLPASTISHLPPVGQHSLLIITIQDYSNIFTTLHTSIHPVHSIFA